MNKTSWWHERVAGRPHDATGSTSTSAISLPRDLAEHEESTSASARPRTAPSPCASSPSGWTRTARGRSGASPATSARTRLIVADDRDRAQLRGGPPVDLRRATNGTGSQDQARGDFDHLVFATTDPGPARARAPLRRGLERGRLRRRVGRADGRRGRALAPRARPRPLGGLPRLLRAARGLLRELGRGDRGKPPASITILSGDVHHAYLAEVAFRRGAGVQQRRVPGRLLAVPQRPRLGTRSARSASPPRARAPLIGRALARAAGAHDPGIRWRFAEGPYFDNQVATLSLNGRSASLKLEKTEGDPESDARSLETVFERRLA